MATHTFIFSTTINQKSISTFLTHIETLLKTECDVINILINSSGGVVTLAFGLVQLLQSLPCKIITYNIGKVDSAALLLFAVGDERIALPQSRFFAHEVTKEGMREHKLHSLRCELEEIELDTTNIATFLAGRTKLTQDIWKTYMEKGEVISPTQALSIGLITSIDKLPQFLPPKETFHFIAEV